MPFIAILEEYANGVLAKIHLKIHTVYATECKAEILTSGVIGKFGLLKCEMSFPFRFSAETRKNLTFQALLDPAIPRQPVLDIRVLDEIGTLAICQVEIEMFQCDRLVLELVFLREIDKSLRAQKGACNIQK